MVELWQKTSLHNFNTANTDQAGMQVALRHYLQPATTYLEWQRIN